MLQTIGGTAARYPMRLTRSGVLLFGLAFLLEFLGSDDNFRD